MEAVLEAKVGDPSPVIGIEENKITRKSLMEAVKLVRSLLSSSLYKLMMGGLGRHKKLRKRSRKRSLIKRSV